MEQFDNLLTFLCYIRHSIIQETGFSVGHYLCKKL
jgi:hypothetical protein